MRELSIRVNREPLRGNKQNRANCLYFCCAAHLLIQCQKQYDGGIEVHSQLFMKASQLLTGLLIFNYQETFYELMQ